MKIVYEYKPGAMTKEILDLEKRLGEEMEEHRYVKKQVNNHIEWISLDNDGDARAWLTTAFWILLVFAHEFPPAVQKFDMYYDKENQEKEDIMPKVPFFIHD